jgi:hypothetical protein
LLKQIVIMFMIWYTSQIDIDSTGGHGKC